MYCYFMDGKLGMLKGWGNRPKGMRGSGPSNGLEPEFLLTLGPRDLLLLAILVWSKANPTATGQWDAPQGTFNDSRP